MKTDDEIMRVFELADPARNDSTRRTDAAGYLASIQTRSNDMKLIDMEAAPEGAPRTNKWVAIVTATAAAILLIVAAVTLAGGDDEPPAAPFTPPSTAAPTTPQTTAAPTGLDVIQAGVAAFYSGDADRAAQLFDLADRTDDQIRSESAYQAAIGGHVEISCTETGPGAFDCRTPYTNALTKAAREGGGDDVWPVTVTNGVITKFGFTEHSGLLTDMATYLASEGRFAGFEGCLYGPFDVSCATIENTNLDGWVAWRARVTPADRVKAVLRSWYSGDCEAAVALSWDAVPCSPTSVTGQTTEYESILQADVSVEQCDVTSGADEPKLSCQVKYSSAMSRAVGTPPSVTTRNFLLLFGLMTVGPDRAPWYTANYPDDTLLHDSFTAFAAQGDLAGQYSAAGCATTRSAECANLIVDNLDAWAAWYRTNA